MIISRAGTFSLDGETVTGLFVPATVDELRSIPYNPLSARVELHPPEDCPACHGCGNIEISHVNECSKCNGTGKLTAVCAAKCPPLAAT